MIIELKRGTQKSKIASVLLELRSLDIKPHHIKRKEGDIIIAIGLKKQLVPLLKNTSIKKIIEIKKPYQLISREYKKESSIISIGKVKIGGKKLIIIAGPCSVESEEQIIENAFQVKKFGGHILRGGAFKPRTSPYSFQGLGEEGLKYLKKASKKTGLPIITEVLDTKHVKMVEKYTDIFQIGSRNMQNFELLKAVGRSKKPVFLKRGFSATLQDFLMSAEYISSEGNMNVILCERGIRTFCEYTRNTLDLNIVPVIKQLTHLPIIVDPSHGTGRSDLVLPLSKAAIADGADGLMIEVHQSPEESVSDKEQAIDFAEFREVIKEVRKIAKAVDREL